MAALLAGQTALTPLPVGAGRRQTTPQMLLPQSPLLLLSWLLQKLQRAPELLALLLAQLLPLLMALQEVLPSRKHPAGLPPVWCVAVHTHKTCVGWLHSSMGQKRQ